MVRVTERGLLPEPCEHDTLGCGWREPHDRHTKTGDGRPCCGWPPRCREADTEQDRRLREAVEERDAAIERANFLRDQLVDKTSECAAARAALARSVSALIATGQYTAETARAALAPPSPCETCGVGPSAHTVSKDGVTRRECCRCHVLGGAPPADWHPLCMETYRTMGAKT